MRIARAAEGNLKELTQQWLGRELPDWDEPCPISVTLGAEPSRGSSTFVFRDGRVARQEVHLQGTLERILDGVLPHELSHVVLTRHFGRPFPRWADEGGAALAEGELQRKHYRQQMHKLLATPERCIPLRDLFELERYPRDAFAFYETGFSISRYLVGLKGRREFVAFVAAGMERGWTDAVRRSYGFDTVDDLQLAWLASLHNENDATGPEARPAPARTARSNQSSGGDSAGR